MKKKSEFRLYGIFGYPLAHTLSPAMQEAAFRKAGIKAYDLALELDPIHFRMAMRRLRHFLLDGFNVTVPYKEAVIPHLDRLTPEARVIGAVNTVFRRSGKWVGANTDAFGFMAALEKEAGFRTKGKKALVLGAGGSARAVIYALAKKGASHIQVANRHEGRAQKIGRDFKRIFRKTDFVTIGLKKKDLKEGLAQADLVVNATSVGLHPQDKSLIPAPLFRSLGRRRVFFDLIYRPVRTDFLKKAATCGHRVVNGLEMLLWQGAKSFEIWTGRKAPIAVMRKAL